MGKKFNKSLESKTSVRNFSYNLRKRKPIDYYLKRNYKLIDTIKKEEFENGQFDTLQKFASQCDTINILKSVDIKHELIDDVIDVSYKNSNSSAPDNVLQDLNIKSENEEQINVSQHELTWNISEVAKNEPPNEIEVKELIEISKNASVVQDEFSYSTTVIKEEPLSQPSENFSQTSYIEGNLFSVSPTVKKESISKNLDEKFPCDPTITSCLSSISYLDRTNLTSEAEESNAKQKFVDQVENIFDHTKRNITSVTGEASESSSDFNNSVSQDLNKVEKFKPPQLIRKKIVLVKEEKLSDSEKERIEEERDNICRKFAAKNGGIWRRLPPIKRVCGYIPEMPDVVPIYTPSGQRFELYPNLDKPDEFPTKEDKENWDHATRINVLRVMNDIEDGSHFPPGIDVKREMKFKEFVTKWETGCKVASEAYLSNGGDFSEELRYFELEETFLNWNLQVSTNLSVMEYEINKLTNTLILSDINEFLFIKNYNVFQTLKKATQQNQYPELRYKADLLFTKLQNICRKSDARELEEYIHSKAMKLLNKCKDYPLQVFSLLSPKCREAVELDESSTCIQFDRCVKQDNEEKSNTNSSNNEDAMDQFSPMEERVIALNNTLVSEE